MAISFGDINGSAKKSGKYMKLVEGDNTFRIIGGILPGYTYWVTGSNGKDAPFECLTFDRKTEKFNNSLTDPVRDAGIRDAKGDSLKCSWSYKCQVINRANNTVETLQLKKGMLQDIIKFAKKKKIDPTSHETGCDITVARTKTGPLPFNVVYSVDPFSMDTKPLSPEDLVLIEDLLAIEELYEQEDPVVQRERLAKHLSGQTSEGENNSVDSEAVSELE